MSNWVTTQNGYMNTDEGDLKKAEYFLGDLIWSVRNGRKKGGYEKRDVMGMMINWFRIGQILRTPEYPRYFFLPFIRDGGTPPPPPGRKASEILLNALQRLDAYPTSAGADARAVYFAEAEKAMITFINEYRKVLAATDPATLKYFIGQIMTMAHLGHI